jgi:hypothetical protein
VSPFGFFPHLHASWDPSNDSTGGGGEGAEGALYVFASQKRKERRRKQKQRSTRLLKHHFREGLHCGTRRRCSSFCMCLALVILLGRLCASLHEINHQMQNIAIPHFFSFTCFLFCLYTHASTLFLPPPLPIPLSPNQPLTFLSSFFYFGVVVCLSMLSSSLMYQTPFPPFTSPLAAPAGGEAPPRRQRPTWGRSACHVVCCNVSQVSALHPHPPPHPPPALTQPQSPSRIRAQTKPPTTHTFTPPPTPPHPHSLPRRLLLLPSPSPRPSSPRPSPHRPWINGPHQHRCRHRLLLLLPLPLPRPAVHELLLLHRHGLDRRHERRRQRLRLLLLLRWRRQEAGRRRYGPDTPAATAAAAASHHQGVQAVGTKSIEKNEQVTHIPTFSHSHTFPAPNLNPLSQIPPIHSIPSSPLLSSPLPAAPHSFGRRPEPRKQRVARRAAAAATTTTAGRADEAGARAGALLVGVDWMDDNNGHSPSPSPSIPQPLHSLHSRPSTTCAAWW